MEVDRNERAQKVDKRGAGLTCPSPDLINWSAERRDYLVNFKHEAAVGCRLELRRGDTVAVIGARRQLYVAKQHHQFQVVIAGARFLHSQTHGDGLVVIERLTEICLESAVRIVAFLNGGFLLQQLIV